METLRGRQVVKEERFRDRREAGRLLAGRLRTYRQAPDTIVLGLPRGGVVPAFEIARELELPLDVLISRKLRAPGYPEFAIGAISEGGEAYLNPDAIDATGASRSYIASETGHQQREIAHRRELFRAGAPLKLPPQATVILVDDGIATGATVVAAIQWLRQQRVGRIVLAAAVAPPDTVERLRATVDEMVVLRTPPWFRAVGEFYEEFAQVSDEEVAELLSHAERPRGLPGATTGQKPIREEGRARPSPRAS